MGKGILHTLLGVLGAAILVCACEHAGTSSPIGPVPGPNVMLSGLGDCEQPGGTGLAGEPQEDRLEATVSGGTVAFKHSGATFNCCLDSITLAIETGAAEILVRETSHESQPCFCLCDYEVYGEIADLPAGTYTLVICGPGQSDQAKCSTVVSVQ